jgi:hypothetical protein
MGTVWVVGTWKTFFAFAASQGALRVRDGKVRKHVYYSKKLIMQLEMMINVDGKCLK